MTKKQDEAALAAGWKQHWTGGRENRLCQWQYPQLSLRVWAQLDGVHVLAYVEQMGENGRLRHVQIASAAWAPKEVTDRLVVAWGARALSAWLADHMEP